MGSVTSSLVACIVSCSNQQVACCCQLFSVACTVHCWSDVLLDVVLVAFTVHCWSDVLLDVNNKRLLVLSIVARDVLLEVVLLIAEEMCSWRLFVLFVAEEMCCWRLFVLFIAEDVLLLVGRYRACWQAVTPGTMTSLKVCTPAIRTSCRLWALTSSGSKGAKRWRGRLLPLTVYTTCRWRWWDCTTTAAVWRPTSDPRS